MGLSPRPPVLLTEPRDGFCDIRLQFFFSLSLNFIKCRLWKKPETTRSESLMHKADYLNEKSRSIKSDFSTIRKTRGHVQQYIASDTGPWSGGGNRNWSGLWQIENPVSLLEKVFFSAPPRYIPCRTKSLGQPDHLLFKEKPRPVFYMNSSQI